MLLLCRSTGRSGAAVGKVCVSVEQGKHICVATIQPIPLRALALFCVDTSATFYLDAVLQEDSFLELLEGQGFAVQEVPQDSLAPEYRTGVYRVVRACRIE